MPPDAARRIGGDRYDGQTISVIDLPSRLGSATVRTTTAKLVIVATKDGDVGFIVDAFKAIKHVRVIEHSTREADIRGGSAYGRYWRLVDAIDKVGRAETCAFPLLDLVGIADNVSSVSTGQADPEYGSTTLTRYRDFEGNFR